MTYYPDLKQKGVLRFIADVLEAACAGDPRVETAHSAASLDRMFWIHPAAT